MARIPRSLCPRCGYLDGDHALPVPSADSYLICLNCGTVNRFDDRLRLTAATEEEMGRLSENQLSTIHTMQQQIRQRGPIMKPEKPS
jgi:hypothetical protein